MQCTEGDPDGIVSVYIRLDEELLTTPLNILVGLGADWSAGALRRTTSPSNLVLGALFSYLILRCNVQLLYRAPLDVYVGHKHLK